MSLVVSTQSTRPDVRPSGRSKSPPSSRGMASILRPSSPDVEKRGGGVFPVPSPITVTPPCAVSLSSHHRTTSGFGLHLKDPNSHICIQSHRGNSSPRRSPHCSLERSFLRQLPPPSRRPRSPLLHPCVEQCPEHTKLFVGLGPVHPRLSSAMLRSNLLASS